ncbi:MAG: hypothetical protein N2738_03110, partial [Thermodesulfovibrionales bacterium]|nr:hypothetical protein [Thermodesulfovibrionales bacterium]
MVNQNIKKVLNEAQKFKLQSKFHKSFDSYLKAKEMAQAEYDVEAVLSSLVGLGHISRMLGEFERSKDFYKEAIELAETVENNQLIADCLLGISLSLKGVCLWKEALSMLAKAKKIYRRKKDKKALYYAAWAEGTIYRVAGEIEKSLACFHKAAEGFLKTKFTLGYVYSYCGLGGSYRIAGDIDKSLYYYRLANGLSLIH